MILNNFGVILKKLPEDIFSYIKQEVSDITSHDEMLSGMSGVGVPKHYYLNDSTPLREYVISSSRDYFNQYRYAIDYKNGSDGVDTNSKLHALEPWINIQRKNEWIPPHDHSGVMAYSIWVSVPENNVFEIIYSTITGEKMTHNIQVTKELEGHILFFPSKLMHCVHPFYTSDGNRISISGNLIWRLR